MNNFQPQFLDHVALRTHNPQALAQWYCDVLHLTRFDEPDWGDEPIMLMAGQSGLALFGGAEDVINKKPDQVMRHFAFRVSKEDFEKAKLQFESQGVEYREADHGLYYSMYISDPEQNTVELTKLTEKENYVWDSFTQRIEVTASVEQLWVAWTTRHGLESWFVSQSPLMDETGKAILANVAIQTGDKFEWRWYGYDIVEKGTFLQVHKKQKLRFTFGNAGEVQIDLTKTPKGCAVVLKQEGIATDEKSKAMYHVGCQTGWTFYLSNLKSVLEGGLDLRNKDPNTEPGINN